MSEQYCYRKPSLLNGNLDVTTYLVLPVKVPTGPLFWIESKKFATLLLVAKSRYHVLILISGYALYFFGTRFFSVEIQQ